MSLRLQLQYGGEEDYGGILDQLQTENMIDIEFTARKNGPFHAANVCDILAMILAKPNLKQITYQLEFDHDLEYNFPKNFDVKKIVFGECDLTFWIWKQIMESTPNVEEIYIHTEQDITELPMIIQSLNGFKKLKSLIVQVDNYCEEEELEEIEILSMEVKKVLAEEAIKIMKNVLPIELKASVAENLDLDHLDDMDNGIDSPANMLVLIEKEANEDPKLIMLQRYVWPGSELTSESELEEQSAPFEPSQHRSQVEPASLTVELSLLSLQLQC
jgi:hypothetical protein